MEPRTLETDSLLPLYDLSTEVTDNDEDGPHAADCGLEGEVA